MTDRYAGFLVTLAEDMREDDARQVLAALRMIRGVVGVELVVSSLEMAVAQSRVNTAWINALPALALNPPNGGDDA